MTMLKTMGAIAVALTATMGQAQAGVIPYPNAGVENPTVYSFVAASNGDVVAYFFHQDAGYTNEISLFVNGVWTGIQGLNNHTSIYGQSLNFGPVNAGDSLVFQLVNIVPGGVGPWYSDLAQNSDGFNHIYSTDFAGDFFIPAGTYIGFEDLDGGGDRDYNDEEFVITNIANVPEPSTIALGVTALLSLIGLSIVRQRRTS